MADPVTLARPYAKAAFQSARDSNELPIWSSALKSLAIVADDKKVREILSSPLLTIRTPSYGWSEKPSEDERATTKSL